MYMLFSHTMTNGLQQIGGNIELVVQLIICTGFLICMYYFVDHPNRLLFWLDKQSTAAPFGGVHGVEKLSHISAPSCSSGQSLCFDNLCFRVCCRTSVLASLSWY